MILVLRHLLVSAFAFTVLSGRAQSELRQTLNDVALAEHWIYDDYPRSVAQAKQSGKPLLVLFR